MEADGNQPGSSTYLVEHYWPGVTAVMFEAAADRLCASTEQMELEGAGISFLHSTLVPKDEAAFCVFDATSERLVADAYARAGVPFERIVGALEMPAGLQARLGQTTSSKEE